MIESSQWQWNLTSSSYHNSAVLGDIDNDGDLDMISIGCTEDYVLCTVADKSYVWINNGTSFIENLIWEQNLSAAGSGSLVLGDIDNDGYLDLIISGAAAPYTQVYINNGTTFNANSVWQDKVVGENGAASDSVALGDIDNDGDLDLLFPGMSTAQGKTIYLNNGTTFINNSIWGEGIIDDTGKLSTGLIDLDNDGDLDLNIMGAESGRSYINNDTNFIDANSIWGTLWSDEGSIAWGDIDNDGDFDYVVSGSIFVVGINNGTTWINGPVWQLDMSPLFWGSIMLGDYDNNGYLDLVNSGSSGGNQIQIGQNNKTSFLVDLNSESNLTGVQKGSVLWGDVDNDGDLDLIVIKTSKVYINNITTPNIAPTPPTSFSYSYNNREIKLGWNNGSDTETPSLGLYYNLKLGNATNNHSIISGVYGGSGDASRGGTAFGYFGNMMQRKNFTLKVDRLQPSTTYYWSVQTIDTGLEAGNWSEAQSFKTQTDMERPVITLNSPVDNYNSSSYIITFNASIYDNLNLSNVSLWGNWTGSWEVNFTNVSGVNNTNYIFEVNLTGYNDGRYSWMIDGRDNATNIENSSTRVFTLDTTAPNITNENKSRVVVYTNTSVRLNASIIDSFIGINSVWISINITGSFANYTLTASGNNNYSYLLDSGNYSKSQNVSWRYYANDSAGNIKIGTLQSFVIANSIPVLIGIPDNSTNEDTVPPDKFYNLSVYASDVDNDNLTFYIQSQSNLSLINCSVYNESISYYMNCTQPSANLSGNSTIIVNVTDGTAWANDTFIVNVTAVNDVPWLIPVNITAGAANLTNETLRGSYIFNDVESLIDLLNETKWYRNGSEVASLRNYSYVNASNTIKNENWTFSARVYDGTSWSLWYNSSILKILNSVPDFINISNKTWIMNSNYTLNLSSYFSDIDSDALTYTNTTTKNITLIYNGDEVMFSSDLNWNGTSYIVFNANDSSLARDSNNITLTVFKPTFNSTEFDGSTTNFSNLTNFVNISMIIEKGNYGKISFGNVTLNSTSVNLNDCINVSDNRIEVNSTALPELNSSATLYLYNLTYTNPRALKNGDICSDCVEVSYSSGLFIFSVTGFSIYSSDETPVTPSSTGGGGGGGSSIIAKNKTTQNKTINETYTEKKNESVESETEEKEETINLPEEKTEKSYSWIWKLVVIILILFSIAFLIKYKKRR